MREGQKYKPKQSTKFPDILKQIGVPSPMSPADNDKIQDWTKLPHIIRAELAALSKFHFQTEEEHKNLSSLLCGILWRILGKKKIFSGSSESVTKEKPLNFTRLRNCVFHNIFSIVFSFNKKNGCRKCIPMSHLIWFKMDSGKSSAYSFISWRVTLQTTFGKWRVIRHYYRLFYNYFWNIDSAKPVSSPLFITS